MKFVVLAALFAAALAADMQLSLTWDCNFHVNLTKNNVYGYHDLHGVMGEQSLLYLHDFCFAAANSTRILRYDVKNNNYMPFVSNTTSGCSFGHTGDWVDWDTIVFRRSFIHNRDPGNVLCPPEIPELAGRTCKEYIYDTYYRYDRIIVDDANRVAWWSRDGGYFFHWLTELFLRSLTSFITVTRTLFSRLLHGVLQAWSALQSCLLLLSSSSLFFEC